jgi:hypothetical protein
MLLVNRAVFVAVSLAAVVVGIVATQVVASPLAVLDCHSDFIAQECLAAPRRGEDRWLFIWSLEWADAVLVVTATVIALVLLLVAAMPAARALRRTGQGYR